MNQTLTTIGISGINTNWQANELSAKAEAEQLYIEAEGWIMVKVADDFDPEDTSQDWKSRPIDVVDPELQHQWKKDRLWMMDPMDGMLGDDAMPALCGGCDGVFWGDEMISMRKTIGKLRNKHGTTINGMLGNVWEEIEPNVITKLRSNRMCKKCLKVSVEARANPWHSNPSYANNPPAQMNLPFPQIPSSFQPLNGNSSITPGNGNVVVPTTTASGMAPPANGWNISYSFSDTDDDL